MAPILRMVYRAEGILLPSIIKDF